MEICGKTISYSSCKKKKRKWKTRNIIKKWNSSNGNNIIENQISKLENKKKELENYHKNKVKG